MQSPAQGSTTYLRKLFIFNHGAGLLVGSCFLFIAYMMLGEAALTARDEAVSIAGEWLRTEQINADLGLGEVDDLIAAVRADLVGRAARFEAVQTYNTAVLRLLHASGLLVDRVQGGTLFETVDGE